MDRLTAAGRPQRERGRQEAIALGRKQNVLVPVAAAVPAETGGEAISALRTQRAAAGFDVHDGEPGCGAFESEDSEEPA